MNIKLVQETPETFGTKILSNNFSTYAFVNAQMPFSIFVDELELNGLLQSGQDYYQGDFSLPSNDVALMAAAENSQKFLAKVWDNDYPENEEEIEEINAILGTSFNEEVLDVIHVKIKEAIDTFSCYVNDVAEKAEDEMDNDQRTFVKVIPRYEDDGKVYDEGETEFHAFESEAAADEFIDSIAYPSTATIIDNEEAYSRIDFEEVLIDHVANKIQIVWDTVDSHINVDSLFLNSDISYEKLDDGTFRTYSQRQHFDSFYVIEVPSDCLEIDEDGEVIADGMYFVDGKWWRDA